MICTVCNTKAIKNVALNKEFYYCQTCKVEVTKLDGTLSLSEQEMDDLQKQVADLWRAMSSTGGLLKEEKPQGIMSEAAFIEIAKIQMEEAFEELMRKCNES